MENETWSATMEKQEAMLAGQETSGGVCLLVTVRLWSNLSFKMCKNEELQAIRPDSRSNSSSRCEIFYGRALHPCWT